MALLAVSVVTSVGLQPATAQATQTVQVMTGDAPDGGRGTSPRSQPPVPGFGVPAPQSLTTAPEPAFAGTSCSPVPGWTASRPARSRHSGSTSAPLVTGCAGVPADDSEVVVRRGDSLWTLVERHLHTQDPAVIAAHWPRWYAANRQLIGPDPDLLLIGQILHIPSTDTDDAPARGHQR